MDLTTILASVKDQILGFIAANQELIGFGIALLFVGLVCAWLGVSAYRDWMKVLGK